jgi:hypothetical protein
MVTIHFFGPKLKALSEYFANNANSPDPEEFARRARRPDADDAVDAAL